MLKLKLQFFGHLMQSWLIGKDPDAGKDWGQEEKGTTEDEMAGWYHQLDELEFAWTPGFGDGQGGLACCESWGHKESDMTERLNWTKLNWKQKSKTKTKTKTKTHNWNARAFSLFSLSFLLSGKKRKNSFFFSSFSPQQIPPSFYFLHINGEREIDGILVLVWLRTKPQFCSLWQSPAVQPRGQSPTSNFPWETWTARNLYWGDKGQTNLS